MNFWLINVIKFHSTRMIPRRKGKKGKKITSNFHMNTTTVRSCLQTNKKIKGKRLSMEIYSGSTDQSTGSPLFHCLLPF